MRIAFLLSLTDQWTGGFSYYENLFRAIRLADPGHQVTLTGILNGKSSYTRILSLLDAVHELPPADFREKVAIKIADWLRPRPSLRRFIPQLSLSRVLKECHADVVFTTLLPDFRRRPPVVSWIPDFQYRHMPELFSAGHRQWLEGNAHDLAEYSSAVVLSSQAARGDFAEIVPAHSHKARILHFVSGMDDEVYCKSPGWVCDHYHLSERFFFLPNQFWQHKNHLLVLDALVEAAKSESGICVVATGLMNDSRSLTYPSELVAAISQKGLRQNFILLGYVPRAHLYALMRQSIALLQPSLFEGWSTSVEEAKSLGKRVLLSDIPVHREQDPAKGHYFPARDTQALARSLLELWKNCASGPDLELERQARAQLPARVKQFGESFLIIVREALG